MLRSENAHFLFIPAIESHFDNFLPIVELLKERGYVASIFYIEELITKNRHFKERHAEKLIFISSDAMLQLLNDAPSNTVIVVGNDSDKQTCKIIRSAKKRKFPIVLIQDGWLDAKNIRKPIYPGIGITTCLKKQLHRLLAKSWMPTKPYVHNFIAQNANHIFVYSDIAKDNFLNAGVKEDQLKITGSPRHTLLQKSLNSITAKSSDRKKAVVLFTNVIENEFDAECTYEGVRWIIEMFSSVYPIVLKLHPMEDGTKYTKFLSDNVTVKKCKMDEFIASYEIQFAFCFASTVVFDMLMLNISILQLAPLDFNKVRTNYFKDLGLATNQLEFKQLTREYNLEIYKKRAIKYLIDLDKSVNSIIENTNALINIIK